MLVYFFVVVFFLAHEVANRTLTNRERDFRKKGKALLSCFLNKGPQIFISYQVLKIMQLALAGVAGSGPVHKSAPTYWPRTSSAEPGLTEGPALGHGTGPAAAFAPGGDLTQRKTPGLRCTSDPLTASRQSRLQAENDNEQFPSEDELSVGRKGSH